MKNYKLYTLSYLRSLSIFKRWHEGKRRDEKRLKSPYIIGFLFFIVAGFSQQPIKDSLLNVLLTQKEDSAKVETLIELSKKYRNADTVRIFLDQAKTIAEKINYNKGLALCYKNIGISYYSKNKDQLVLENWNKALEIYNAINDSIGIANIESNIGAVYMNQGDDVKAAEYYMSALSIAEKIHDTLRIATVLNNMGSIYMHKPTTHQKALDNFLRSLPLSEELKDKNAIGTTSANIGEIYMERGLNDSALYFFNKSLDAHANTDKVAHPLNSLGTVYKSLGNYSKALHYHELADSIGQQHGNIRYQILAQLGIGNVYQKIKNNQKALKAYQKSEKLAVESRQNHLLKYVYNGLAVIYALKSDYHNAYTYQKLLTSINDTLLNAEAQKQLGAVIFDYEISKKQSEINLLNKEKAIADLELNRQKFAKNALVTGLTLVSLIIFILYRNNRHKQKTNQILESTLSNLKSTQAQLIQSEKMASLGELTAGIAHEIQNPLNFVNNFSEVNKELLGEMNEEIERGNLTEIKAIANDVIENSEKISHHGKRAESIVKGMLEHSRKSSGVKELTDINKLCDEFVRLSYHGLRAKDKDFNCDYKLDLDPNLPLVNVVSQDIGRVLLNIINNAFQACNDKSLNLNKRIEHIKSQSDADQTLRSPELVSNSGARGNNANYSPLVIVNTKYISDKIEIIITDNGSGISDSIKDKIFQPFFTTKPTGQGTGLGLSLSYDIIKAHGGEITVTSNENVGTEFIIQLPVI